MNQKYIIRYKKVTVISKFPKCSHLKKKEYKMYFSKPCIKNFLGDEEVTQTTLYMYLTYNYM